MIYTILFGLLFLSEIYLGSVSVPKSIRGKSHFIIPNSHQKSVGDPLTLDFQIAQYSIWMDMNIF